jgi:hypothetical protein
MIRNALTFRVRPQLGLLKNDAGQLLEVISRTAALAEKISEKVRRLDLEQVGTTRSGRRTRFGLS